MLAMKRLEALGSDDRGKRSHIDNEKMNWLKNACRAWMNEGL